MVVHCITRNTQIHSADKIHTHTHTICRQNTESVVFSMVLHTATTGVYTVNREEGRLERAITKVPNYCPSKNADIIIRLQQR